MLDFIINPIAGGRDGKKMKKNLTLIEKRLIERQIDHKLHFSEKTKDATELTKKLIKNGATDVIVVGGDGTLHEVINGFSNFESVNLGLIPCGTGNDFASALKLPSDPVKALDVILDGSPKYTDYMQMPTVRGINVIGMGIDVEVLKKYDALKKKTKFGYTKCLLNALFEFKCSDFDAVLDDGDKEHYRSFIVAVANGHRFGGGLEVCPVADPADGKLDFFALLDMSKLKVINAFLKLKQKKILQVKQAVHKTMEKIAISCPVPYTVNVDGELYENIPFEIKVVSNTLRMYR